MSTALVPNAFAALYATECDNPFLKEAAMSDLGHNQTFAAPKGMSALPPKADIKVATVSALGHEQK